MLPYDVEASAAEQDKNMAESERTCGIYPTRPAARVQQPAMPVIGYLGSMSSVGIESYVAGFRRGLNEAGCIEGQNVAIDRLHAQAK
jgi:hypothetical protein